MHCSDAAAFCSPFVYCRLRPVLRSIIQQAVGVNPATFGLRMYRLVESLIRQMDIKGVRSIGRELKDKIAALSWGYPPSSSRSLATVPRSKRQNPSLVSILG
jgi:hypothetical protein